MTARSQRSVLLATCCCLLLVHVRTISSSCDLAPSRRSAVFATATAPWTRRAAQLCASESTADGCSTDLADVNIDGLRKEAQRVLYRAQKKVAKAEDKAAKCEAKQEALLEDPNASLEALEALPNCAALRDMAAAEAEREHRLSDLVAGLQAAVASDGESDEAALSKLVSMASELGVNDCPPPRAPPKPRKKKGPRPSQQAPRLPYRVFTSEGGAEIRVGKQAKDNDVLSCDPAHRDNDDWWLHASGCPGSHVIIRTDSLAGGELPREVELDAAVLAANYSKAALNGNVPVNLCKARQVSKPSGAKPGLVQLSGDVKTIKLNWKIEKHRLERLQATLPEQ